MKFLSLLCLLLVSFNYSCAQDESRNLIPRSLLLQDAKIKNVQLSRNGEKVYFLKETSDTLFYLRPQTTALEKFIVFPEKINRYAAVFNGGIIAVSQKGNTAKLWYSDGGTPKDITPFAAEKIDILAHSAKLTSKVAVLFDTDDLKEKGVWLVDVSGQSNRKVGIQPDDEEWFFDEFFQVVAKRGKNNAGGYLLTVKGDTLGDYPRDMTRRLGGLQNIVSVTNDGKTVYYTDNATTDKSVLRAYDTGTKTSELIAEDNSADLIPAFSVLDENGKPLMVSGYFADVRRKYLDEKAQADMLWLQKELTGSPGLHRQGVSENAWLVSELSGAPVVYHYFDRKEKKLTRLFSEIPALDAYPKASRTAFTVRTRDAMQLPVHVYLPAGTDDGGDGYPDEPLPTILFVHGGPWNGVGHWNSWALTRHLQLLANRGYAVINTEFRGSTGLGKAFTDAGDGQWGGKMRLDLEDIARWAQSEGIAAEDKIGVWGHSYGGYAVNTLATLSPGDFAVHISHSGVSDLTEFAAGKKHSDTWMQRVGDPDTQEGAALLKRTSPINYVEKVTAPVMLIAGSLDERVPQSQSDIFADALADNDKEVLYVAFPEENHHFTLQNSWLSFWAITEQYLAKYLGGDFQPKEEDLEAGFFDVIYGGEFTDDLK